jgi:hypothetical protein
MYSCRAFHLENNIFSLANFFRSMQSISEIDFSFHLYGSFHGVPSLFEGKIPCRSIGTLDASLLREAKDER